MVEGIHFMFETGTEEDEILYEQKW